MHLLHFFYKYGACHCYDTPLCGPVFITMVLSSTWFEVPYEKCSLIKFICDPLLARSEAMIKNWKSLPLKIKPDGLPQDYKTCVVPESIWGMSGYNSYFFFYYRNTVLVGFKLIFTFTYTHTQTYLSFHLVMTDSVGKEIQPDMSVPMDYLALKSLAHSPWISPPHTWCQETVPGQLIM